MIEAGILFAENESDLWFVWSTFLFVQKKSEDALDKINTAITKFPDDGDLYGLRAAIKLGWWEAYQGPKPSKSEVINDFKNALKFGYEITQFEKERLASFLNDEEYKTLLGTTKEEDGFGKE